MSKLPQSQLFNFSPIGFIETGYPDKFGIPRQSGLITSDVSILRLLPSWQPEQSLMGLEGFTHLWLIWVFHRAKTSRFHSKVHPPRMGGKSMGLFSTRTPHRPNPIGLSLVELIKLEEGILYLKGVDMMDGTPIIDIKPYLPEIESKPLARSGWTENLEKSTITVEFAPEALNTLELINQQNGNDDLYCHIQQCIALDPRPLVYREMDKEHWLRLFNFDINFKFTSLEKAIVLKINIF